MRCVSCFSPDVFIDVLAPKKSGDMWMYHVFLLCFMTCGNRLLLLAGIESWGCSSSTWKPELMRCRWVDLLSNILVVGLQIQVIRGRLILPCYRLQSHASKSCDYYSILLADHGRRSTYHRGLGAEGPALTVSRPHVDLRLRPAGD